MGKLIDGQYVTINAVDPIFVRSAKAEANAIRAGMTKEYIESRGGINASGYYGDSFNPDENLSPEEYDAVIQKSLASGLQAVLLEPLSMLLHKRK